MNDQDLFDIYQEAGSPRLGLRAIFDAGRQAERQGEDVVTDDELNDTLIRLNGNYELRSAARTGE